MFSSPAGGTPAGTGLKRSQTQPLFSTSIPAAPGTSLFGTAASTQAGGPAASGTSAPSLFAPTMAISTAGGSSLFGQPPKAGAPLLGGLGAPGISASQPSIFGSTGPAATPQPAGSQSLLGSLGASRPASTSLFPPLNSTNNVTVSTLPAPVGATTNPNASVFGTIARAPPSSGQQDIQASKSSYFDHMVERGKKRNMMENGGLGELPALQLGLADIARKARNLGTGGPSAPDAKAGASDSRAHYLLAASGISTAAALRDLNNFAAQAGAFATQPNGTSVDADIDTFVTGLRTQSTLEMIQESLEQSKRDFDTFLEDNVQMNWEAQRRKIYEHFGLARGENLDQSKGGTLGQSHQGAFGRSSRRNKGLETTVASGGLGTPGFQKSVLGTSTARASFRASAAPDANGAAGAAPPVINEDRTQRERQEKYIDKICELNRRRSEQLLYPLLHNLAEVEKESGDQAGDALRNAYKALVEIVGEEDAVLAMTDPRAQARERTFRAQYLDDNPNSANSINIRKRVLNGSRRCLENLFRAKIEDIIKKDPKVANVGGVPEPIQRVRAYIRVLAQRKNLVLTNDNGVDVDSLQRLTTDQSEDDYCWALIYFMLRCGLLAEARAYVDQNAKAIRALDRNFSRFLFAYADDPDRRLTAELRQQIQNDYHSKTRIAPESQIDPYKIACYKIIGRCELSRKTLEYVPTDEEDWIWLQFALAREVNRVEEAAGEAFGLEQLRDVVRDIGQRYFAGNGPDSPGGYGTFFFLQILAGMFEQAVAWLYSHNHIAAVHFAIALAYYGLLRVADMSTGELLTYTTRQQTRLQYALILGYYTADFRGAKPEAAVDYLILLSLNADLGGEAGHQQARICLDALRDLVLETREFALLLGDIRQNGEKLPGAVEVRARLIRRPGAETVEDFIRALTIQAAYAADESGRVTDAVLLYHLAGEFDNVLTIVNRTLSEALTVDLGAEALRLEPLKPRGAAQVDPANSTLSLTTVDDPVILASNMLELYSGRNRQAAFEKIKRQTRESAAILLRMAAAKQHLLGQNYNACVDTIGTMDLLPLGTRGNISDIRRYAQNFSDLPPVVARVVGDLLVWAVVACHREKARLTKDSWEGDNRSNIANQLAIAMNDLSMFAGMVKYKLRQGVFDVLAQFTD